MANNQISLLQIGSASPGNSNKNSMIGARSDAESSAGEPRPSFKTMVDDAAESGNGLPQTLPSQSAESEAIDPDTGLLRALLREDDLEALQTTQSAETVELMDSIEATETAHSEASSELVAWVDRMAANRESKAKLAEATDHSSDDDRVMQQMTAEQIANPSSAPGTKQPIEVPRGRLNFVLGEATVSSDSMAAYLADEQGLNGEQIGALPDELTASVLQLRDALLQSSEVSTDGAEIDQPTTAVNLSAALARLDARIDSVSVSGEQDLMTKTARLSPIVELVAGQAVATRLTQLMKLEDAAPGQSKASQFLIDLKTNQIQLASETASAGEQQSAWNELNDRGQREMQQPAVQATARDFRELLAEHLRKADNLRELSDRLGTMIARQITAQIAKGRWTLEMALHPAELGSIEVEMEMTERGLEANFKASQAVTRDLLMESMARLKAWFEEGGIDVAYAGLSQDSGAQHGGNSTPDEDKSGDQPASGLDDGSQNDWTGSVMDLSQGLDVRV